MIPYLLNDIYQYPVTKPDASKAASDTMVHIRQCNEKSMRLLAFHMLIITLLWSVSSIRTSGHSIVINIC